MYIATTYWSNSLHIGNMRVFKTEKAAWDYLESLYCPDLERPERETENRKYHFGLFSKVYKLYPDKKPKLLKKK